MCSLAAIKEVDVDGVSQKACVLIAPFPLLAAWRKASRRGRARRAARDRPALPRSCCGCAVPCAAAATAQYPAPRARSQVFKVVQEKLEKNMNVCLARPPLLFYSPPAPPRFPPFPHPPMQQHHVVLIAQRTQMDRAVWARSVQTSGVRPRSRSLKAVQEALLDDLVYPADIVGKRTRVKANGSHVLKVFLSQKEKTTLADKLDSLTAVYTKVRNGACTGTSCARLGRRAAAPPIISPQQIKIPSSSHADDQQVCLLRVRGVNLSRL
jgi:hypothetical protein